MPKTVPGPRPLPVIGTAYSIDPDRLVESDIELAKKYGEIFVQRFPGRAPVFFVSSKRLVEELCDESRFDKQVHPAIANVTEFSGNGLFTAETVDPNWQKAHRILMPAFNPTALAAMYDGMTDIAEQLVLKWTRQRNDVETEVTDEFTRLTLDTIALCSFSYRFNSFYSENQHPFVDAMVGGLEESSRRAHMPEVVKKVLPRKKFDGHIAVMHDTVDQLIEERRRHPSPEGEEDILDTMLNARDPETGERLSDTNVRYQLVNFLIAGHETTSGLLSFALYELMSNRAVFEKARTVVDEVLGDRFPTFQDLPKLGYIDQILRETLRLHPTAPAFAVDPFEPTTIGDSAPGRGDGYAVKPGDTILILAPLLHRDPAVWSDPERFDPDRFSFENAQKIPNGAWKPFGNGQRSCIGRGFALQEALLVLTLLIQRFDPEFVDPSYKLAIKETLTIKPDNLLVYMRPRKDKDPEAFGGRPSSSRPVAAQDGPAGCPAPIAASAPAKPSAAHHGTPLQVLYGSDAGTCKAFAEQLVNQAESAGFDASISALDEGVDSLSTEGPVLVVTSSYEGLPPRSAKKFVDWLGVPSDTTDTDASDAATSTGPDLSKVTYAVFGAGNSEWASTFQRIPTLVDDRLSALGAQRLIDRGAADVRADHQGTFIEWTERLWPAVAEHTGVDLKLPETTAGLQVSVVDAGIADIPDAVTGGRFVQGTVVANDLLSTDADGAIAAKRHIGIRLPDGVEYATGDYLEVLPRNTEAAVNRALRHVGLAYGTRVSINGPTETLPTGTPVAIGDILSSAVDLNAVIGRRALTTLAEQAQCPPEAQQLHRLATEECYADTVVLQRLSVLDVLDANPSVSIDAGLLLDLLTPMTPRRYSISSAVGEDASVASLTISQVSGPAWSGQGEYHGAATSFLGSATPGTTVPVRVTPGPDHFRPPQDPTTPMVLVGAGSGIAPLRAFLADVRLRAEEQGVTPATSLLFFGCHGADSDHLYREEMSTWAEGDLVDVRPAYSRHITEVNGADVRYAQDRLWADREDVLRLLDKGATVYVCGDAATLTPGTRDTMRRILAEKLGDEDAAAERLAAMETTDFTYVTEAFT